MSNIYEISRRQRKYRLRNAHQIRKYFGNYQTTNSWAVLRFGLVRTAPFLNITTLRKSGPSNVTSPGPVSPCNVNWPREFSRPCPRSLTQLRWLLLMLISMPISKLQNNNYSQFTVWNKSWLWSRELLILSDHQAQNIIEDEIVTKKSQYLYRYQPPK